MNALQKFTFGALAGIIISAVPPAGAQEPIETLVVQGTSGQKTYTNVRVLGMTEKGLKISHDAGISVLSPASLPGEIAKKYVSIVPSPTEAPAPSRESPADLLKETAAAAESFDPNCLIFIRTEDSRGRSSSGSGFIALVEGRTYVYTNAHVLCGTPGRFTSKIVNIKTVGGRSLALPHEIELSETFDPSSPGGLEDMARFPVASSPGETAYEIRAMSAADYMGKEVVAYGDSLGGGVMTTLKGQIIAMGTDRLEINCEIVPGNSGGPVVLAESRQVAGISTYLTTGSSDIWSANTSFDGIRRFAIRPEQVKKWRRLQLASLMAALREMDSFERDTLTLAAACFLNPRPNRGGFEVPNTRRGDYIIKDIIVNGRHHPLGATISSGIATVNQKLSGSRTTLSMQMAVPVFTEFFSSVARTSASQIAGFKDADRAPYLKQFTKRLAEIRVPVHEQFVQEGLTRYR